MSGYALSYDLPFDIIWECVSGLVLYIVFFIIYLVAHLLVSFCSFAGSDSGTCSVADCADHVEMLMHLFCEIDD